jgi:hypothetical protein
VTPVSRSRFGLRTWSSRAHQGVLLTSVGACDGAEACIDTRAPEGRTLEPTDHVRSTGGSMLGSAVSVAGCAGAGRGEADGGGRRHWTSGVPETPRAESLDAEELRSREVGCRTLPTGPRRHWFANRCGVGAGRVRRGRMDRVAERGLSGLVAGSRENLLSVDAKEGATRSGACRREDETRTTGLRPLSGFRSAWFGRAAIQLLCSCRCDGVDSIESETLLVIAPSEACLLLQWIS